MGKDFKTPAEKFITMMDPKGELKAEAEKEVEEQAKRDKELEKAKLEQQEQERQKQQALIDEALKAEPPQIPAGYKLVPIEKKTQRVQLVLRPSLVKRAKDYAKYYGESMNEIVTMALEDFLKKEGY